MKQENFQIGRDAGTGRFMSVRKAKLRKKTAIVETIKRPSVRTKQKR